MNSHDIKAVEKILRHCDRIERSVKRVGDYSRFVIDEDAVDAAVNRVAQIGELSHRELSDEFRESVSGISWKAVYSMRNHLVHGYDKIELPMLWETITEDVPMMAQLLRRAIGDYRAD